jgi:hypothetical protein
MKCEPFCFRTSSEQINKRTQSEWKVRSNKTKQINGIREKDVLDSLI